MKAFYYAVRDPIIRLVCSLGGISFFIFSPYIINWAFNSDNLITHLEIISLISFIGYIISCVVSYVLIGIIVFLILLYLKWIIKGREGMTK